MDDIPKSKEYRIWKETLIKILGSAATEMLEKKVQETMEREDNTPKTKNC